MQTYTNEGVSNGPNQILKRAGYPVELQAPTSCGVILALTAAGGFVPDSNGVLTTDLGTDRMAGMYHPSFSQGIQNSEILERKATQPRS
jgi:hypothetical protein